MSAITLRSYQLIVKNKVREAYKQGKRAVLAVVPTGGGKTAIFCDIALDIAMRYNSFGNNKTIWILAHKRELVSQASKSMNRIGCEHGIVGNGYTPQYHKRIQVASILTIINRLDKLQEPGFIILDEAHHAKKGNTIGKIFERFPNALKLGVTATPVRGDGVGLGINSGGYFDEMVVGPQMHELMGEGWLTTARVFGPKRHVDLSDVDIVQGDYDKAQVLEKVDKPTITGDAIQYYTELCPGAPCVVFCISIEHAEHVAEQFRAAGYLSESVSGNDTDEERDRKLSGLADKSVQVLTTCDLISEGTDLPEVVCGICLRPTASEGLHIQQIGRVLRAMHAKGYPINTREQRLFAIENGPKPFAIILDHVENYRRHGRPKDERFWSLDGSKKNTRKSLADKLSKIKTVQCPKCYFIHEPEPVCPNTFPTPCGHVYETKSREIKKQDGELIEITDEIAKTLKKEKKTEISRARTLEDFQAIASARGYKSYWAMQMWNWKRAKLEITQPVLPNSETVVYNGDYLI